MKQYLENQYLQKIYLSNSYIDRKCQLDKISYSIKGITKVGKTMLVKNYLLTLHKKEYLYIDCSDIRINLGSFSQELVLFCKDKSISTLVLDNYNEQITLPNVEQLIIISSRYYHLDHLTPLELFPLDYEEFLAYEGRFDSAALNHYFKLGGLPLLQNITSDVHNTSLQQALQLHLNTIELSILILCTKLFTTKLSVFNIYEKLKKEQKISKDKLYLNFQSLVESSYIFLLKKFEHPKATHKIYLSDISFQASLSLQKNFSKVFENSVYIHLQHRYKDIYYYDGVDFYVPAQSTLYFALAFIDERTFFKKLEGIEAFIFQYRIEKIICVTLNNEANLAHPFSQVDMVPFATWALSE